MVSIAEAGIDPAVAAWVGEAETVASRLLVIARPGDVAAVRSLLDRLPSAGLSLAWLKLAEDLQAWMTAHENHPLPAFRDWGALEAALHEPPVPAFAWQSRADLS